MKYIRSSLNNELNKEITKQCKEIGYKRSDVLGYLIDNPAIIENICKEIFSDINALISLMNIELSNSPVSIAVNTDNELLPLISKHNITVNKFLFYIATNSVITRLKDVFPEELKMKKSK